MDTGASICCGSATEAQSQHTPTVHLLSREPEEIFILGTAHVSQKSAEDAARVVKAVTPACVIVELCRSRASQLCTDEESTSKPTSTNPFALSGKLL